MEFISQLFQLLIDFSQSIGYWGILLLMTVESSFIPFPSELVVPPAAYLAAKGEMNVWFVILFGILGSLVGAVINYYLAMYLGRPLVYELVKKKWAKFLLLSEKNVKKSEKCFAEYGNISTFLARLLPGIRQLISLPAGFTKMPLKSFLFYTFLGSGIWVSVLAALGYYFGENEELLAEHYKEITIGCIIFVLVVFIVFFYVRKASKLSLRKK